MEEEKLKVKDSIKILTQKDKQSKAGRNSETQLELFEVEGTF